LQAAVYIGDTATDEAAAKAAGIPFIFAEYGFGQASNADFSIASLKELL
jgi:phosphoglycolate phosphatase